MRRTFKLHLRGCLRTGFAKLRRFVTHIFQVYSQLTKKIKLIHKGETYKQKAHTYNKVEKLKFVFKQQSCENNNDRILHNIV